MTLKTTIAAIGTAKVIQAGRRNVRHLAVRVDVPVEIAEMGAREAPIAAMLDNGFENGQPEAQTTFRNVGGRLMRLLRYDGEHARRNLDAASLTAVLQTGEGHKHDYDMPFSRAWADGFRGTGHRRALRTLADFEAENPCREIKEDGTREASRDAARVAARVALVGGKAYGEVSEPCWEVVGNNGYDDEIKVVASEWKRGATWQRKEGGAFRFHPTRLHDAVRMAEALSKSGPSKGRWKGRILGGIDVRDPSCFPERDILMLMTDCAGAVWQRCAGGLADLPAEAVEAWAKLRDSEKCGLEQDMGGARSGTEAAAILISAVRHRAADGGPGIKRFEDYCATFDRLGAGIRFVDIEAPRLTLTAGEETIISEMAGGPRC